MAEPDLPPQRTVFLFAAGGGFIGALLAILIAWLITGGFCCHDEERGMRTPAELSSLTQFLRDGDCTLLA
ncbi:MAG TPA: hypothetical protein VE175_11585 [Woeseiaceae bacterium]|nr:hypothetical protein [Woeseiaceae bacterium]